MSEKLFFRCLVVGVFAVDLVPELLVVFLAMFGVGEFVVGDVLDEAVG